MEIIAKLKSTALVASIISLTPLLDFSSLRADTYYGCLSETPTTTITFTSGILDDNSSITTSGSIPVAPSPGSSSTAVTFNDLLNAAESIANVEILDSLGSRQTLTFFAFHTAAMTFDIKAYVNSQAVEVGGTPIGYPRLVGTAIVTTTPGGQINSTIDWNNGSSDSNLIVNLNGLTIASGTSSAWNSSIEAS